MTAYFPMFMPMHFGGGGGRPSNKKELFILLGIMGICIGGLSLLHLPSFQMKVTQKNNYSAQVDIRRRNYPKIKRITNQNIDCLNKKGYSVHQGLNKYYYSNTWNTIGYLDTIDRTNRREPKVIELSKEKFISDCKECNVHTEIIYEYDSIFGNEKQKKKKLYWHKYYKDELK